MERDRSPRPGRVVRSSRRGVRTAGLIVALVLGLLAVAALGGNPVASSTAVRGRPGAPAGGRVDLAKPTFSDPTTITNPLFPISRLTQVLQLGAEGDVALRHEITLLPETKVIRWDGKRIETLVSQFVAYGDGRILEVATDYFAQADDGSVWYFGEHVDNYEDGVIANHEGTWLAGRDGPPGMIMPARPRVGDVYRPENIPGLVFEEVTVKAVNRTVAGPRGPVRGAIVVQERLLDGTLEDKVFAPGYGEFQARVASEDELVTVALAVPTDALDGDVPRALSTLTRGSADVFRSAPSQNWSQLTAAIRRLSSAWDEYRARPVPSLLAAEVEGGLDALRSAVAARRVSDVRQSAVDLGFATLDLELRYRSPVDVDEDRQATWRRQLVVDRAAGDTAAVASDKAVIAAIELRTDDADEDDDRDESRDDD